MELVFGLIVVVVVGLIWKTRQRDKQTTLDFDDWLSKYEATNSPFTRSGMAVAFLQQSIHFAWTMGAINSKQKEIITSTLKQQRATTTMMMWLGSALPAVIRVVGKEEVANTPARGVGMLMLLAWMSPDSDRENVIRQFLFRR